MSVTQSEVKPPMDKPSCNCACHVLIDGCLRCNGLPCRASVAAPPPATDVTLTDEPCERCKGSGEVEGHGGNNVYCGACAGTGKKPRFGFNDHLPLTACRIAPGEYDIKARDGRVLWRMEGASFADWICASVNGYDAAVNAIRSPSSVAATVDAETKAKEIVDAYKQRITQLPPVAGEVVPCRKWLEMRLRIAFDHLGSAAVGQQELERLKKWQDDVVEREAAVCPEDVPFDEYIRHLERKLKESTSNA